MGRLRTPEGVKRAVELAELVGASHQHRGDAGSDEFSAASSVCAARARTPITTTRWVLRRGGAQASITGPGLAKVAGCATPPTSISGVFERPATSAGRAAAVKSAMPDRGRRRGEPSAHDRTK